MLLCTKIKLCDYNGRMPGSSTVRDAPLSVRVRFNIIGAAFVALS